jgi:nicotinic acid mononucleotide adenylyltransferase
MSSTDVRLRLERGEPWQHLVPPEIVGHVRAIFAR